MKFKGILLLCVFSWCIIAPTVIILCNTHADIAVLFSASEEENTDSNKTVQEQFNTQENHLSRIGSAYKEPKTLIYGSYRSFWKSLPPKTTSPPPERIS